MEIKFEKHWKERYTIPITLQHRFHHTKQWRFDFCFPEKFLAVEIQGFGTGHTSYEGMSRDYEKHNEAVRLGWSIIYIMSRNLLPGEINKTMTYIHTHYQERSDSYIQILKEINSNGRNSQIPRTESGRTRSWKDHLDKSAGRSGTGTDS